MLVGRVYSMLSRSCVCVVMEALRASLPRLGLGLVWSLTWVCWSPGWKLTVLAWLPVLLPPTARAFFLSAQYCSSLV